MMISSAVIIPEGESSHAANGNENTSPSLKRKLSHSSPNERKRPKVDTDSDTLNYDDTPKSASPKDNEPKPAAQTSPPRRRPAPAVDEKKRNQRLFGSLLGTLSQSGVKSNPAHKKRDEIEARQRERLKREHEEQETARKRKKEDLAQKRRKEQRYWEEESQRLKHANMRTMAGFLRTKTEPMLYYLPWELRQDEEVQIQRQRDETESLIQQEVGDIQPAPEVERDANEDGSSGIPTEQDHVQDNLSMSTPLRSGNSDNKTADIPQTEVEDENSVPAGTSASQLDGVHESVSTTEDLAPKSDTKDDDQHGDEPVATEGQEDDVIY